MKSDTRLEICQNTTASCSREVMKTLSCATAPSSTDVMKNLIYTAAPSKIGTVKCLSKHMDDLYLYLYETSALQIVQADS